MNDITLKSVAPADAGDLERSRFDDIARALDGALAAGERHAAWLEAETSDFVRMNRGKVRQAGHVEQRYLRVRLIRGMRHAEHTLALVGDAGEDARAAVTALAGLRDALSDLQDDPYLMLPKSVVSDSVSRGGPLPASGDIIGRVLEAAGGDDLVGR